MGAMICTPHIWGDYICPSAFAARRANRHGKTVVPAAETKITAIPNCCVQYSTCPVASDDFDDGLAFSFRQGMFVTLLNPKAILFYIAFLPQFVDAGHGSEGLQLAAHGVMVIVLAVLVYVPVIALADKIAKSRSDNRSAGAMLNRLTGCVLIGLGARIAVSR